MCETRVIRKLCVTSPFLTKFLSIRWMRHLGRSVTRFGDLLDFRALKPLATINLTKLPTFLGIFCKVDKIFHFSSETILGQLL